MNGISLAARQRDSQSDRAMESEVSEKLYKIKTTTNIIPTRQKLMKLDSVTIINVERDTENRRNPLRAEEMPIIGFFVIPLAGKIKTNTQSRAHQVRLKTQTVCLRWEVRCLQKECLPSW